MKKLDFKHIAFHILIALYFIWLTVYVVLIAMALANSFNHGNPRLTAAFAVWLLLNLVTGSALFIVIRLFRNRNILTRLILHTYWAVAIAAVIVVCVIKSRA